MNQIDKFNQNDDEYTLYLFFNSDLKMSKGQISAQSSHITHVIVNEIVSANYESTDGTYTKICIDYAKWCIHPRTISLSVNTEKLIELCLLPNSRKYDDYGFTTCVGFFPNNEMANFTSIFKKI